jgi:IclR family transcriptional regulator, acetate operon repressor
VSISERLYGIASITAPVRAPDNTLVGVLGVTGDANDFTDTQIAHLIPEVRRAATALGERLPAA